MSHVYVVLGRNIKIAAGNILYEEERGFENRKFYKCNARGKKFINAILIIFC